MPCIVDILYIFLSRAVLGGAHAPVRPPPPPSTASADYRPSPTTKKKPVEREGLAARLPPDIPQR